MDDASFPSIERPSQDLAPSKEKYFWPVFELVLGVLNSVSVFLMHFEVSCVSYALWLTDHTYIEGLIYGRIYKP